MGVSRAFVVLPAIVLVTCGSCDSPQRPGGNASEASAHPGATAVEPGSPELKDAAGQKKTIYVPAYSAIAIADNAQLYQLAITLSVRNTDRTLPIIVTAIRYYHQDGRLVREMFKTPLRVAPLASLEFFLRAGDTSGGTVPSFLVDWIEDPVVSAPIVETVMVGTSSSHGIAFTCAGRPLADRSPRAGIPPAPP